MAATSLGLYDLLAPHFLAGFTFPPKVDAILSTISVETFRTVLSDTHILYYGRARLGGDGEAAPVFEQDNLNWKDVDLDFRLTVPRDGTSFIETAADALDTAGDPSFRELFEEFGPVDQDTANNISTEFPGVRFRLELLLSALDFHLSEKWRPGKIVDGRVVPDAALSGQRVKVSFFNAVMEYEHGDNFEEPSFRLKSLGNSGFDGPTDLAMGEVISMDPPLALRNDGKFAIGVEELIVDFSENNTPPEILSRFGADEGFKGIYVRDAQVFWTDDSKDWGFRIAVNDLLLSFKGDWSFDVEADLLGPETKMSVQVDFYNGKKKLKYNEGKGTEAKPNSFKGGNATVPTTSVIHLAIQGGAPPFDIDVEFVQTDEGGDAHPGIFWDIDENRAMLSPGMHNSPPILEPAAKGKLLVTVKDSTPDTPLEYSMELDPFVITDVDLPAEPDGMSATPKTRPEAQLEITGVEGLEDIEEAKAYIGFDASKTGETEHLNIQKGPGRIIKIDNTPLDNDGSAIQIKVPEDQAFDIEITYPGIPRPHTYSIFFSLDQPTPERQEKYENGTVGDDTQFTGASEDESEFRKGLSGFHSWLEKDLLPVEKDGISLPEIEITTHASHDQGTEARDQRLTDRRLEVIKKLVGSRARIIETASKGRSEANGKNNPKDRVALIQGSLKGEPEIVIHARITRQKGEGGDDPPVPPKKKFEYPPTPGKNNKPQRVFRRIGARLKMERGEFILAEVRGKLDFETEFESKLRNPPTIGDLDFHPRAGATQDPNPEDGVVDFSLSVVHDPATHFLTEKLTLGSGDGDRDGLLQMTNPNKATFKDIFGALAVFAPIINDAAEAFSTESADDWVPLAIALGVPIAIGSLDVFQTESVTLFGGELSARQHIPPGESLTFTDTSLLFDYGVAFHIKITDRIRTQKPLKVRYKAVGFNLHFPEGITEGEVDYQPVFDTSKGYEIDLSDPGLFSLPAPLDSLLSVLGARLARFNPLTLEVDLGLKADLGVVTVDRFKIKAPLDPIGLPTIMPTGVKVDLSGVLVGSGFLDLGDDKISGGLDITLVPVKLRVAGNLEIDKVEDPENPGRTATAVFASLVVGFPSPVVLLGSGMGLYGLSGLFAMHYKRLESPRPPDDPVSPALHWLKKAEGEPEKLQNRNGERLWGPEIDRWSFGVGAILGTLDGGTLVNVNGMLMVELPGPRILVFSKIQIIQKRPDVGGGDVTTGILGVVDLDFNLDTLTVGVLLNYEVKKLISIKVPLELFFDLRNPFNWHLHAGTISNPISAEVLNLVRARGYLMMQGSALELPIFEGVSLVLPGIAVATGIEASITIGSTSIGLYLRVASGSHLGIAFSPFLITGQIFLEGELRLFIVSIGASGRLALKASREETFIKGEVCGKVSFFFFSVEGCVGLEIGNNTSAEDAPALVRNLFLQSYAPVIAAGQGADRPIDASLGDAVPIGDGDTDLPIVPINTVPVVQMHSQPAITGDIDTFTLPVDTPPAPDEGWISVGGGRQIRYTLNRLTLDPPLPTGTDLPPATWRRELALPEEGNGDSVGERANTNVDLALFSRIPVTASIAAERSSELDDRIRDRWGSACEPVAPPVCVLWTFCDQPFGPSGTGWQLDGIPQPDPPGTTRHRPPPTRLFVEEPSPGRLDQLLNPLLGHALGVHESPAKIIGRAPVGDSFPEQPGCLRALQFPQVNVRDLPDTHQIPSSPEVMAYQQNRPEQQWITLHSGAAPSLKVFLAVTGVLTHFPMSLVVRCLDASGALLDERPLINYAHNFVSGTTNGLPAEWIDPQGPWSEHILPVATFFTDSQFQSSARLVVDIVPPPESDRIQLMVRRDGDALPGMTVVLGAVEVCPQSEINRAEEGEAINSGEVAILQGFLSEVDPLPLLMPDTTYTIGFEYTLESRLNDPNVDEEVAPEPQTITQAFRFQTDDQPPLRLDPWVLGTSPDNETRHHFFEEAVQALFNDRSVLELYERYGYELRIKLRTADGVPTAPEDPVMDVLEPVKAVFISPFADRLREAIQVGLMPCLDPGNPEHGRFTVPIDLRPSMDYVMDIVAVDDDGTELIIDNGLIASSPLYRSSFSTSRYPTFDAFVASLQTTLVRHRALDRPLDESELEAASSPSTVFSGTFQAPDKAINDALSQAGETALPPPSSAQITVYWCPRDDAEGYRPQFLLIDSGESLWRTRLEPMLEVVPDQDDPAFQRVVRNEAPAMMIRESSGEGPHFGRFVRSTSGTRTLAIVDEEFAPPQGGAIISLTLERPASPYFDLPEQAEELLNMTLKATPSWEERDE